MKKKRTKKTSKRGAPAIDDPIEGIVTSFLSRTIEIAKSRNCLPELMTFVGYFTNSKRLDELTGGDPHTLTVLEMISPARKICRFCKKDFPRIDFPVPTSRYGAKGASVCPHCGTVQ